MEYLMFQQNTSGFALADAKIIKQQLIASMKYLTEPCK